MSSAGLTDCTVIVPCCPTKTVPDQIDKQGLTKKKDKGVT